MELPKSQNQYTFFQDSKMNDAFMDIFIDQKVNVKTPNKEVIKVENRKPKNK